MAHTAAGDDPIPLPFTRKLETQLIDLAASDNTDSTTWRKHGSPFFMSGLAVLLASARGVDREKYPGLAEELHPGMIELEVFDRWLKLTPIRAARFLPRVRQQKKQPRHHVVTALASSLEEFCSLYRKLAKQIENHRIAT